LNCIHIWNHTDAEISNGDIDSVNNILIKIKLYFKDTIYRYEISYIVTCNELGNISHPSTFQEKLLGIR